MYTEKNKKTLHEALAQMPVYDPPQSIWDALENSLDADAQLSADARKLPQYDPPAGLWDQIESGLEVQQPMTVRSARRVALWPRLAVAAAVTMLLFAGWWTLRNNTVANETEQIVVTQEVLDSTVQEVVQETMPDSNEIAMIDNLCASRAPVCEKPEFRELKNSLDELTQAKEELHEAMGQYGDDPELAEQLAQIERERSQLLQEIISMI